MKNDRIQPNQNLKIPLGTFRIEVRKATFTLTLLYNDTVVKEYPVAIGKDDATPEGTFKIANKLEKPDWDKRNDETGTYEKIKYGDPKNVLGERWMGFAQPFTSYGIHGTNDDGAIGTTATKGCVRMRNNDVTELYNMVAPMTEVTIVK
ncbi:MAG: hypothetical protein A2Z34_09090 [Planctomycetes bacterium RBG_16_59_8]|nr:MAG: hypothetical protein A2Z34_09090 [Planctomycetes bacterium RBG_16_59_8]